MVDITSKNGFLEQIEQNHPYGNVDINSAIAYFLTKVPDTIMFNASKKRRDTMDITTVKAFFMWCTIINVLLLVLSFLIRAFAGDWIYGNHSKWFKISREAFNVAIYSFVGVFKIFILVFNIVPWIACVIVG